MNNYENLPAVLNANQLAAALGISRAGAYQLLNTRTFPTLRIGKRLLVATAAALQVEAAIPNFTIHEEHNANLKNIFIQAGKYYYKPENGYYTVPDLPGIGQEMTDEFLATCRKVVIGG